MSNAATMRQHMKMTREYHSHHNIVVVARVIVANVIFYMNKRQCVSLHTRAIISIFSNKNKILISFIIFNFK